MTTQGHRVRKLREAQGLTREQLAVKAGIAARTLNRIENDEGPSYRATLVVISLALGCELSDLTDEEEPVAA